MMTQSIAFKPVASLANKERSLITIEFAPNIHPDETEHTYEHPQFVFGDRVTIGGTSFHYPPEVFTVCALELVESKTPSGKLLSQPRWKYKVVSDEVSYWKEETALTRYTQKTCLTCDHFNNYNEPNGRGWCVLFNDFARTYHVKANDCIINGTSDKSNEVIELDRDGYPMGEAEPTGYFSTELVTKSEEPF